MTYPVAGAERRSPHVLLWVPLTCVVLLMLITFSLPGRQGFTSLSSLDPIAMAKLMTRGVTLVGLAAVLALVWPDPRRAAITRALMPLLLYVGWATVSIAWSPMPAMSIAQLAGLVVQIMLAVTLAMLWNGRNDTSLFVRHLSLVLFGYATIVVGLDLIAHDISGLDRASFTENDESLGMVHPTSAGVAAGLGLVILVLARLLWGWSWSRQLLVPGVVVSSALLLRANSRTSIALAIGLVFVAVWLYGSRIWLIALILVGCMGFAAYLVLDPTLDVAYSTVLSTAQFAQRGETAEQMAALNGRSALWEAIWTEIQRSPIVGHGYFVTSSTGLLEVWTGPASRTAHNVVLQVLVSTGVIGMVLFIWGLARIARETARGLRGSHADGALASFLMFMALWYLGWGQLSDSFMGPVQPESVVFFSVMGLALAQVPSARRATAPTVGSGFRRMIATSPHLDGHHPAEAGSHVPPGVPYPLAESRR